MAKKSALDEIISAVGSFAGQFNKLAGSPQATAAARQLTQIMPQAGPKPTGKFGTSKGLINPVPAAQINEWRNKIQPIPNAKPGEWQGKVQPMAAQNFKFAPFGQKDYSQYTQQILNMYKGGGAPLQANVQDFVKAGNKYGVDPRILAVIGQIESSGGKKYPVQSNNPFGYIVNGSVNNAGFTSVPHAIDRLTYRFAKPGTSANYNTFRTNPTFSNLQAAYNANPAERDRYIQIFSNLVKYFGQ